MANDILLELDSSELKVFKKDFIQMVTVAAELDKAYEKGHGILDSMIPKYEKLVGDFNKKYIGLRLKVKKSVEHFTLKIFAKEHNVKDFFANSASNINGIKSIGRTNFNQADVGNMEKFAQVLESVNERIFISYSDPESGTSTLAAVMDKKENMVEILTDSHVLASENSSAFKICSFYALKNEKNMHIDIRSEASTFGFSSLLNEIEKREWFDRFKK